MSNCGHTQHTTEFGKRKLHQELIISEQQFDKLFQIIKI